MSESDPKKDSLRDRLDTTKEKITVNLECVNDMETNVDEKEKFLKSVMDELTTFEDQMTKTVGEQETQRSNIDKEIESFFSDHKRQLNELDNECTRLESIYANLDETLVTIVKRTELIAKENETLQKQEADRTALEQELDNQRRLLSQGLRSHDPSLDPDGMKDEIDEMKTTCENLEGVITSGRDTITSLTDELDFKRQQVQLEQEKAAKIRKELETREKAQKSTVDELHFKIEKMKVPSPVPDLTKTLKAEQKNLKTMLKNRNNIKQQNTKVTDEILKATSQARSAKQQIEETKQKADELRDRQYKSAVKMQQIQEKFHKFLHTHKKKERVMADLKSESEKLTQSYNIESRQNKLLPSLLKSIETVEEEAKKLEHEWTELDHDSDDPEEYSTELSRIWQDLHLKLQLARLETARIEKNMSREIEDIKVQLATEAKETKREIRTKTRLARINTEIYAIQQEIVKEKERQRRQLNSLTALENQSRHRKEEIERLKRSQTQKPQQRTHNKRISTEEIRLATRKAMIAERRRMLNTNSNTLFEKVQNMNTQELINTHAMKCDPAARIMLMKRATCL